MLDWKIDVYGLFLWLQILMEEFIMFFREKIEELEAERQRLEEQNNILEMRLERHNLQVIL